MLADRQIEVWKEEVFGPAVAAEILLDTHRILEREKIASWLVSGGRDGEKVARSIASSLLLEGLCLSSLHIFFADGIFTGTVDVLRDVGVGKFKSCHSILKSRLRDKLGTYIFFKRTIGCHNLPDNLIQSHCS